MSPLIFAFIHKTIEDRIIQIESSIAPQLAELKELRSGAALWTDHSAQLVPAAPVASTAKEPRFYPPRKPSEVLAGENGRMLHPGRVRASCDFGHMEFQFTSGVYRLQAQEAGIGTVGPKGDRWLTESELNSLPGRNVLRVRMAARARGAS